MKDGKLYYTPKEVYPIIRECVKGKIFCDLGCGNGAILEAMKGVASAVTGIDTKPNMYLIGDFTEILPEADVYYLWVGHPEKQFNKIKHKLKGKTLLIGAHGIREIKYLERIHRQLKYTAATTFFGDISGVFRVGVLEV